MLALAIEFSRSVRKRTPKRARRSTVRGLAPSVLNSVPRRIPRAGRVPLPLGLYLRLTRARRRNSQWIDFSSGDKPTGTDPGGWFSPPSALPVLLRKEVIQPHLPVRLPCYDFVPIAEPTFDGSLHKGWATGFGCSRLS